jgi:hypothetical protein
MNTREKLNAQTMEAFKTNENIREGKALLPGRIEMAKAGAMTNFGNQQALQNDRLSADQKFQNELSKKDVISPGDLDYALAIERKEILKQNPNIKEMADKAAADFAALSSKERADEAKKAGLPADIKPAAYGEKVMDKAISDAAAQNVKARYGDKRVSDGDKSATVKDVIDHNVNAPSGTGVDKSLKKADAGAPVRTAIDKANIERLYQQDKGAGRAAAEAAYDKFLASKKSQPAPTRQPVAPAAPPTPQVQGPITDPNQLWPAPPPVPGGMPPMGAPVEPPNMRP